MTTTLAQRIFEREGYLVYCNEGVPARIGEIVEEPYEGSLAPVGTKLVVVGTITQREALAFCNRNLLDPGMMWTDDAFYYKVVAE